MAGCGQANAFARIALYDVLERLHTDLPLERWQFVDDVVQLAEAAKDNEAEMLWELAKQGRAVAEGIEGESLRISATKSRALASSVALARRLLRACRKLDVPVGDIRGRQGPGGARTRRHYSTADDRADEACRGRPARQACGAFGQDHSKGCHPRPHRRGPSGHLRGGGGRHETGGCGEGQVTACGRHWGARH